MGAGCWVQVAIAARWGRRGKYPASSRRRINGEFLFSGKAIPWFETAIANSWGGVIRQSRASVSTKFIIAQYFVLKGNNYRMAGKPP